VAIFGRKTVRQRLRTATRESLIFPTFSSAVDCTPWVTGGLWPAELSTPTAETRRLADHLQSDLQRITRRANDELTAIKRANMGEPARRAHEARVIAEARAHAVRRIESTLRQQQVLKTAQYRPKNGAKHAGIADLDKTRVMPAVTALPPASDVHVQPVSDPRYASTNNHHHAPTEPLVAGPPPADPDTADAPGGRHRPRDVDNPAETTNTDLGGLDAPDRD
jgi:hypothetical protein